ncbi:hypothetical protein FRC10_007550 [Ceratobasidium sp. 414]|nr:hypothetical protein FRC10_007550 [Ceratobasidium sp. 414]
MFHRLSFVALTLFMFFTSVLCADFPSCSATDWKAAYDYSVALCNTAGVTQTNILNPPPSKRDFVPVYFGRAAA